MTDEKYKNMDDEGYDANHHTGKPCVTGGCQKPAGTLWGPYFCAECNVARIERINQRIEVLEAAKSAGAIK